MLKPSLLVPLLSLSLCRFASPAWAGAQAETYDPTESQHPPQTVAQLYAVEPPKGPPPTGRFIFPLLRLELGSVYMLDPKDANPFSLSIQGGALIGWPRKDRLERAVKSTLWLLPELGYDYRRVDSPSGQPPPAIPIAHHEGHLMTMGMGVGYGSLMYILGTYSVRLIAGSMLDDGAAVGLRHGINIHALGTLVSANIEHQVLSYGGVVHQDLLVTAGLNLLMPFFKKWL